MLNTEEQIILENVYSAESIVDIDEDFHWALNQSDIQKGDDGFPTGHFEVIITYKPD